MKNKFAFTISILMLCAFLLACSFKFGDTGESSANETSQKRTSANNKKSEKRSERDDLSEDKQTSSQTDAPEKIGSYNYQRFDYSVYLIPKNLSESELTEVAQKLRDEEPKAFLVLVDDDSKARQYIAYHEQADEGTPDVEFPMDWANEHIVASVIMFLEGEKKWYLTKGYGYEKIAELE